MKINILKWHRKVNSDRALFDPHPNLFFMVKYTAKGWRWHRVCIHTQHFVKKKKTRLCGCDACLFYFIITQSLTLLSQLSSSSPSFPFSGRLVPVPLPSRSHSISQSQHRSLAVFIVLLDLYSIWYTFTCLILVFKVYNRGLSFYLMAPNQLKFEQSSTS